MSLSPINFFSINGLTSSILMTQPRSSLSCFAHQSGWVWFPLWVLGGTSFAKWVMPFKNFKFRLVIVMRSFSALKSQSLCYLTKSKHQIWLVDNNLWRPSPISSTFIKLISAQDTHQFCILWVASQKFGWCSFEEPWGIKAFFAFVFHICNQPDLKSTSIYWWKGKETCLYHHCVPGI